MPDTHQVDLLVIGGGINGAGVARDAAGRGLSVCLTEQSDLAASTSSASSKLIHGGLRYLEYGEVRLVREALMERERLLRIAPHLVSPLRFVLPHAPGLRSRWQIRLGLFAYDHMGIRRRLPSSKQIRFADDPSGRPLKPDYVHGFTYADCSVDDSRLVLLNALDAARRGATILTRTRLLHARIDAGCWLAECVQSSTGRTIIVRARAIVNAAGCWVNRVRNCLGLTGETRIRLIQGGHIVVPRLFEGEHAYLLQNPDRRVVFAIPFEERFTLIGTTDVPYEGDLQDIRISPAEITYLCESLNHYFKRAISPADVIWSYSGIRTLLDNQASEAAAVTRDYDLKLEFVQCAPALSVIGGKITTYRKLAEAAVAVLRPFIGGPLQSWTAKTALPGGEFPAGRAQQFFQQAQQRWHFLSPALVRRLARSYGARIELLLGRARSAADLGENLGADLTAAEVDYLREHEWAVTAQDILWRRSKLGLCVSSDDVVRLEEYLQAAHHGARGRAPG